MAGSTSTAIAETEARLAIEPSMARPLVVIIEDDYQSSLALTMLIDVTLESSGGGTELRSVFDVTGTGPLKPIVDRLFEKRATERTAQFAEALARRFSRPAPASS